MVLFYISYLLVEVLTELILLPSWTSLFMTITLNSLSGKLLIYISLSSFMRILSCSFIWKVFLCLLFLTLCVWFFEVGILAMCPGLKRVALYRRCPVEPSGAVTHHLQIQVLQGYAVWAACTLLLWLGHDCCRCAGGQGLFQIS